MTAKSVILGQLVTKVEEIKLDKEDLHNYIANPCCIHNGYIVISFQGKQHKLHRLIMDNPVNVVDHINGNTLDNRRSNLRLCSQANNSANRNKSYKNTSGYKGVSKARNKWAAKITKDYKVYHIGNYTTPELAALAYNKRAVELFGQFAKLNVIAD